MTQGTRSVLFGCHSIIHSVLVVIAWHKIYGSMPRLWEVVCIILHDVGHIGLNYLDSVNAKKQHWRGGAYIAYRMFGDKGYELVAGHCSYSLFPKNRLYYADKCSWYIAPKWWLYWNCFVEPELKCGESVKDAVEHFKDSVRESIELGRYDSTHEMYLKRVNEKEERERWYISTQENRVRAVEKSQKSLRVYVVDLLRGIFRG